MKLTTLDLEFDQPSGKIIQIGAVVGETNTGEISQRLRIYVNPNEPISEFITNLCGITQHDIDTKGIQLDDAYQQLKEFHRKHTEFVNPVTWGGGDSEYLREQLSDTAKQDWCFGRRWIDAKTVYVGHMILHQNRILSGGLNTAMHRLGLKFQGRKHDALDDAENTFKIYHHMLYLMKHGEF